jgi:hypothetical protein
VYVLKYLGWNYVSVVYSTGDDEFTAGYKLFQAAAVRNGICLALEEGIPANMSMVRCLLCHYAYLIVWLWFIFSYSCIYSMIRRSETYFFALGVSSLFICHSLQDYDQWSE